MSKAIGNAWIVNTDVQLSEVISSSGTSRSNISPKSLRSMQQYIIARSTGHSKSNADSAATPANLLVTSPDTCPATSRIAQQTRRMTCVSGEIHGQLIKQNTQIIQKMTMTTRTTLIRKMVKTKMVIAKTLTLVMSRRTTTRTPGRWRDLTISVTTRRTTGFGTAARLSINGLTGGR